MRKEVEVLIVAVLLLALPFVVQLLHVSLDSQSFTKESQSTTIGSDGKPLSADVAGSITGAQVVDADQPTFFDWLFGFFSGQLEVSDAGDTGWQSQLIGSFTNISQVALDAYNSSLIYFLYEDLASNQTNVSVSLDGGSSWSTYLVENRDPFDGDVDIIAVSPSSVYATYIESGQLFFESSSNTGQTWARTLVDGNTTLAGHMSIDTVGTSNVFISYYDDVSDDLKFARSANGGSSWTIGVVQSTGDLGSQNSLVAINTSHLYIASRNVSSNGSSTSLMVSRSSDGGDSWTTSLVSSQELAGQFPTIRAVGGQSLYIAYGQFGSSPGVKFANSSDGGITWSLNNIYTPGAGSTFLSKALAIADAQRFYVAFRSSAGLGDLIISRTNNAGASWSSEIVEVGGANGPFFVDVDAPALADVYVAYADYNEPIYRLGFTESNASSSCGSLTTDTVLINDVGAAGTCFTINADDITLDCAGFDVEYSQSQSGYGVDTNGFSNVTIQNCDFIQSLANGGGGILFDASSDFVVTNTNISSGTQEGLEMSNSDNNTFTNVRITPISGAAIIASSSSNNVFVDSTITSSTSQVLSLTNSHGNTYDNVFFSGTQGFSFVSSQNNSFNESDLQLSVGGQWISTDSISTGNSIKEFGFFDNNARVHIYPLVNMSASTAVNNSNLLMTQDTVFLNSSQLQFLNTSARLSFYSVSGTPVTTVDFDDDGTYERCTSPQCGPLIFSAGAYVVNVSSFTTYRMNSAPSITGVVLNSSARGNRTEENLTATAQNLIDGDSVKFVYNWFVDDRSMTALNMPFEGGSNSSYTKDYSGYGNDGSGFQNPVWSASAGHDNGGAYVFDGQHRLIDLGNPSSLNFTNGSFSLEAWINVADWIDSASIMAKGAHNSGFVGYNLRLVGASGTVQLVINDGVNVSAVAAGGVPQSVFNHVVGVVDRDAGFLRLYINGSQVANATILTSGSLVNPHSFFIGRNSNSPSSFFNGTIDEVRVWDRALSPVQIQALFLNKSNLVVSDETASNETWYVNVTPNDGFQDGATVRSNDLQVQPYLISSCQTLSSGHYLLTKSVSSNDTCFTISGPNVRLDCADNTIGYSSNDGDSERGILVQGNNASITNCVIVANTTSATNGYGIYLDTVTNVSIINVTMTNRGSTDGGLIRSQGSSHVSIDTSTFFNNATGIRNYGIYVVNTDEFVLNNSNFTALGGAVSNYWMYFSGAPSDNASIANTVFGTNHALNYGIYATNMNNIIIDNVTALDVDTAILAYAQNSRGFSLTDSNLSTIDAGVSTANVHNITIDRSSVRTGTDFVANSFQFAIQVTRGSNATITNNDVWTYGGNQNYGVYININTAVIEGIRIENNTIRANGTGDDNYGVHILNTQNGLRLEDAIVRNNTIYSDGRYENTPIQIESTTGAGFIYRTIVEDNVVFANGLEENHGIAAWSVDNTTIRDNVIRTNNTDAYDGFNQGIYTRAAEYTTIVNNTIVPGHTESAGIWVENSLYSFIHSNVIETQWDGIYVTGNDIDDYRLHSIATNNSVNGRPVYYYGGLTFSPACPVGDIMLTNTSSIALLNCQGLTLRDTVADGSLLVVNGSNVTVDNVTVIGKKHGLRLFYGSSDNSIINNYFSTNGEGVDSLSTPEGQNHGIYVFSDSHRNRIENNTVFTDDNDGLTNTASRNYAIYLTGGTNNTVLHNNYLHGNGVRSNFALLTDGGAHHLIATNNTFIGNGTGAPLDGAVSVSDSINGTWRYNHFLGLDGNGLELGANTDNHLIENNTLIGDGGDNGFERSNTGGTSDNIVIRHNILNVTSGAGSGIDVLGPMTNLTIFNNTIVYLGGAGIVMVSSNNVIRPIIAQNYIVGLGDGIFLQDGVNASVYNNFINSTADNGILLGGNNADGAEVFNNTVYFEGGNKNGIVSSDSNAVDYYIHDNFISNPGGAGSTSGARDGISLRGSNHTVSRNNIVLYGVPYGLSVNSNSNHRYIDNNITLYPGGNLGYGIYIFNIADSHVFRNTRIKNFGPNNPFGIFLNNPSSIFNNSFTNTYIYVPNGSTGRGIYSDNNEQNFFRNTIINQSASWFLVGANARLNMSNLTLANTDGTIHFPGNVSINDSVSREVDESLLSITSNQVSLNTSVLPNMNSSAQVTLRGLSGYSVAIEVDYDDDGVYELCDSPTCDLISYTDGVAVFNVSHWTQFRTAALNLFVAPSFNPGVAFNGSVSGNITDGLTYGADQFVTFFNTTLGKKLRVYARFSEQNVNLSTLVLNFSGGVTVVDVANASGINATLDLFVPDDGTGVTICPNASQINQVSPTCPGAVRFFDYEVTVGTNKSGYSVHRDGSDIRVSNVTGTGITVGTGTVLEIYDSGDVQGGGQTIYPLQTVLFYANYTNLTSAPINGSCAISIDTIVTNASMFFDGNVYNYSASFGSPATYNWSVSCTNLLGYDNLTATDDVTVVPSAEPIPEFSTMALLAVLVLAFLGVSRHRRR